MPAHYVCLSDMHLGYEKSVLNYPAAQDHLVDEISKLCGGSTDRLILNGDCFEGCVPIEAGQHDAAGFNPAPMTKPGTLCSNMTAMCCPARRHSWAT